MGRLANMLEAHAGPLSEDADVAQALMHLDMDGPAAEEDIAAVPAESARGASVVQDILGGSVSYSLQVT